MPASSEMLAPVLPMVIDLDWVISSRRGVYTHPFKVLRLGFPPAEFMPEVQSGLKV